MQSAAVIYVPLGELAFGKLRIRLDLDIKIAPLAAALSVRAALPPREAAGAATPRRSLRIEFAQRPCECPAPLYETRYPVV